MNDFLTLYRASWDVKGRRGVQWVSWDKYFDRYATPPVAGKRKDNQLSLLEIFL